MRSDFGTFEFEPKRRHVRFAEDSAIPVGNRRASGSAEVRPLSRGSSLEGRLERLLARHEARDAAKDAEIEEVKLGLANLAFDKKLEAKWKSVSWSDNPRGAHEYNTLMNIGHMFEKLMIAADRPEEVKRLSRAGVEMVENRARIVKGANIYGWAIAEYLPQPKLDADLEWCNTKAERDRLSSAAEQLLKRQSLLPKRKTFQERRSRNRYFPYAQPFRVAGGKPTGDYSSPQSHTPSQPQPQPTTNPINSSPECAHTSRRTEIQRMLWVWRHRSLHEGMPYSKEESSIPKVLFCLTTWQRGRGHWGVRG